MTGQEATDGWDSDQQFIKDTHRLATAAETKRCVSVLVARARDVSRNHFWYEQHSMSRADCGCFVAAAHLMQAARAISPKVKT